MSKEHANDGLAIDHSREWSWNILQHDGDGGGAVGVMHVPPVVS